METTANLFSKIYDTALIRYQNSERRSTRCSDITSDELHYLELFYSLGKTTLTAFAQKAEISKPAATRIIRKFLDKGYLFREPSQTDKRTAYLELTSLVREHCAQNFQLAEDIFNEMLEILSDDDRQQLHDLMRKINQGLRGDYESKRS